jgi:hypothetical protein
MNRTFPLSAVALLLTAWFVLYGCASPEQNPSSPRRNTGYVDFYTDSDLDLSWEVKRFENQTDKPRTIYSEFDPVAGNVLRLASPPGKQKFQVWFMNRATKGPEVVTVQVEDGKVKPVRVTLTPSGITLVDEESQVVRGSAKGYGRRKTFTTGTNKVYEIGATPQTVQEYRSKEQMPYWSAPTK